MEISRNVIMDLLPLYFANELSEDSRALVAKYLETDPELARLARQTAATALSEKTPAPRTEHDELSAYRKARRVIMWRTIALATIIAVFLVLILAMFFLSSPSSSLGSRAAVDSMASLQIRPEQASERLDDRCAIAIESRATSQSHSVPCDSAGVLV